ncbi:MAG TPA: LysR family transcriptional regulator [Chthoniobacterales bacterium]
MEMHQLRYFLAVAQAGSFTRAAAKCRVAQPSLSQQILKLESELGEKLFERQRQRVTLTAVGERFRQRAERIQWETGEALREVRETQEQPRGKVELGVLPTIAPFLLPDLLAEFGSAHSEIEVILHEETTSRLLRMVDSGEVHLAMVSLPIAGSRFQTRPLFKEELLLALPRRHSLANRKAITLADLESERFIVMQESHCLGTQSLQFCHARGFSPQVSCRSAQIETLQAMVKSGLGISLVPEMARRSAPKGIVYRSLSGAKPMRSIGLIWSKRLEVPRAGRELAAFLEKKLRRTG